MRERHHASRSALSHTSACASESATVRGSVVRAPPEQLPASTLERLSTGTTATDRPRTACGLSDPVQPRCALRNGVHSYTETPADGLTDMADAPQTHGFQNHPTLTTRHNRPVQQSGPGPAPLRDHDSSSARPVYRQLIGAAPGGQAPRAPDLRHREGGRGGGGAAGRKANSRLVPVIIIVRLPRSALDKVASRARHLDRLRAVRAAGIGAAALEAAWGGRRLGGRRVRVSAAGPP